MSLFSSEPIAPTIAEGCPWHHAQITYGTPNVDWCEPTTCAWINEPANTWSNLPFLIVGFLLWRKGSSPMTRAFGLIVMIMGFLSGVYHASNNLLTQHFDFVGMALMMSALLAFSVLRLRREALEPWDRTYWFFLAMNAFLLLFLGVLRMPLQLLMLLNAGPIVVLEIILFLRRRSTRAIPIFALAILTLAGAQVAAQLDLRRIWCEPGNLVLHGHVVWHVLCAVGMGLAGLFIQANSRSER